MPPAELTILFDGLCPACAWEMKHLRRRDRVGAIAFVDIAAADFDPSKFGITMDQAIGAMHAVRADGKLLIGPEAFIAAYRLVGLNWLAAILSFAPLRPFVNLGYRIFAKYRPRFSKLDVSNCAGGRCRIDSAANFASK